MVDGNYPSLSRRKLLQGGLAGLATLSGLGGLEQAVAATPASTPDSPLEAAGDRLLREGRYDVAAQKYGWHLQKHPDDADAHYKLGLALGEVGKLEEGLASFRNGLKIEKPPVFGEPYQSNEAKSLASEGWKLRKQGDYSGALRAYRRSLDLDPRESNHTGIAWVYMDLRDFDQAKRHLHESFIFHPLDYRAMHALSEIAKRNSEFPKAVFYLTGELYALQEDHPSEVDRIRKQIEEAQSKAD